MRHIDRLPSNNGKNKMKKERQKRNRDSSFSRDKADANKRYQAATTGGRLPSESALALSARLKDLSQRKRLRDALAVYRDPSNNAIRDGHHGSIVVDCCSRCGSVEEGEKIVSEMERAGISVSIQAQTALLKGYAHSGQIAKGARLYRSMCRARNKRNRPNVRTLNTLLRGCLWTAATLQETSDCKTHVVGGVVTSEEAWKQSEALDITFDLSSYEYSIALLCQALRCNEAIQRLDEMKQAFSSEGSDGFYESLAVSAICLSRAFMLLDEKDKAAGMAREAKKSIETALANADKKMKEEEGASAWASGGKRSFKSADSRRSSSNTLFRSHRLREIKAEASLILDKCSGKLSSAERPLLPRYLTTRLLYFSGGGTTDLAAIQRGTGTENSRKFSVDKVSNQLLTSLWSSFGLSVAVGRAAKTQSINAEISRNDRKALRKAGIHSSTTVISADGYVDFGKVFAQERKTKRPIHIELGAGAGDWIAMQAENNPGDDWVSVELRSDRVAQTFSKIMMISRPNCPPLKNFCCVGAECGSFLRRSVHDKSITTIFVNHPEPPTQTYGASDQDILNVKSGAEPAHMLHSETLIAAAKCLKASGEGRLVIVTDNRWYGSLICSTLEQVMEKEGKLLFPIELHVSDGYRKETRGCTVPMYEGPPNEAIGHTSSSGTSGTSYFDRLWQTGAGTHAERKKRFVIVMRTYREGDELEFKKGVSIEKHRPYKDNASRKGISRKQKGAKKKNPAAQARRNERRLAKRLAAQLEDTM